MKKLEENEEIADLVNELRQLLEDVGWSKTDLAKKIAQQDPDTDENSEYEVIRKLFNRPPTKSKDRLNKYIRFIVDHRENKRKNFYKIICLSSINEQAKDFLNEIREISLESFKNN